MSTVLDKIADLKRQRFAEELTNKILNLVSVENEAHIIDAAGNAAYPVPITTMTKNETAKREVVALLKERGDLIVRVVERRGKRIVKEFQGWKAEAWAPEQAPGLAPDKAEPPSMPADETKPDGGMPWGDEPDRMRRGWPAEKPTPKAKHTAQPEAVADTAAAATPEPTKPGVILICAADIEPEPIDWLWKDRFALGKISMIAGQGSIGKSQTTIDMAARITTGRDWPNGEGIAPTGNVIFLSAEDDPNDILTPRLMAADADRKRVFFVSMVKDPPELGSRQRQFNVAKDVGRLCEAIGTVGNVRLVVIDPITAYLGSGKDVDSHRATDVRDALNPLLHYTEKLNIATILINHLNKSGGTDAMNRVLGSGAFVQLARTVYLVVPDSEKERALFLPAKNNLSKKPPGLAYKPITKFISTAKHPSIETSCIEWDIEEIDKTADEALADIAGRVVVGGGERTSLNEAIKFLRDLLAEGPVAAKSIKHQASEAGISSATLRRAKEAMEIEAHHRGDGGTGGHGEWVWQMPEVIDLPLTGQR